MLFNIYLQLNNKFFQLSSFQLDNLYIMEIDFSVMAKQSHQIILSFFITHLLSVILILVVYLFILGTCTVHVNTLKNLEICLI